MSIILPDWVAKREALRAKEAEKAKPEPLLNLDALTTPGNLEKFCEDKPELRSQLLNILGEIMHKGRWREQAYREFYGVLSEAGYVWEEWT